MNAEQLQKLKTALTQSCKEHTEKGGTVISGKFVSYEDPKCKCPVICFLGDKFRDNLMSKTIAKKLDIPFTIDDLWSFIYAFDGLEKEVHRGVVNNELWEFGKELRAQLIK